MLPKRQQIYFTSNFWFNCSAKVSPLRINCDLVTHAQTELNLYSGDSERKQRRCAKEIHVLASISKSGELH